MGTTNRSQMMDRLAALVAGPLLLGRHALDLVTQSVTDEPPEPAQEPARVKITPPDHSVMRRG